jgi:hypothetical protein
MRLSRQDGQTLVLSVVFMTVLLGMAAVVLDVGTWYRADRATQATADAAALAGAQALPKDPARAVALADEYATKNGGGSVTTTLSTKLVSNDTLTVEVSRPAPGFFSKLFGIDSVTVGARAAARTGLIRAARYVAPIVVNEQHPMLQCKPNLCSDATELDYYNLKPNGTSDGAGSFGFINLDGSNNNPGSSELGSWIKYGFDAYLEPGDFYARTGNAFSSTNIGDVLAERIDSDLLFPVYRKLTETGSGARYEIVGWVVFHLTDIDLHGSNEKLYGYFKETIWQGIQVGGSSSGPLDLGARSVELVE